MAPDGAPLHDITFPDSYDTVGAAFAGDGRSVLVHIWPAVLNLWAAALYYWPQVLGVVVGVVLAIAAVWIARVFRNPRQRGATYCRRCGYHITGEMTCPECGVDVSKRKPVRGRALAWRLTPPVAVATVIIAGYAALWIVGLPRDGAVAHRWVWDWPWLTRQMKQKRWPWLNPFYLYVDRVVAVDLRSGVEMRTVCQTGAPNRFPIRVSSDGVWLVTLEQETKGWFCIGPIVLRRADSGSVVARLPVPDRCKGSGSYWTHVAGLGDDGEVYCVLSDWTDWTTELVEWQPRTGRTRTILKEPAASWQVNTGATVSEGRLYERVNLGAVRFVSWSDFEEYMKDGRTTVRGFNGDGVVVWEHRTEQRFCRGNLACSTDGFGYMSCAHEGVECLDLRTGKRVPFMALPRVESGWEHTATSSDGRLLFWAPVTSPHILVADTQSQRWLDPLGNPSHILNPVMSVSPDSRWLVATGVPNSGGSRTTTPKYIQHLLIYDISGYAHHEGSE